MFNNIFKIGLKGKLAIIIIVVIFIVLGIIGFMSITSMRNEMEKQITDSQMLLAVGFSADVQQFFEDAKGVVRMTAQLPAVRDVSSIPLIREDIKGVPRDADQPKRDVMNYVISK